MITPGHERTVRILQQVAQEASDSTGAVAVRAYYQGVSDVLAMFLDDRVPDALRPLYRTWQDEL